MNFFFGEYIGQGIRDEWSKGSRLVAVAVPLVYIGNLVTAVITTIKYYI